MTKKEAHEIIYWWNDEGIFQTCNFDKPSYMWPIFVQNAYKKLQEIKTNEENNGRNTV